MDGLIFSMFFLLLMILGIDIYSMVLIASDYRKDGE